MSKSITNAALVVTLLAVLLLLATYMGTYYSLLEYRMFYRGPSLDGRDMLIRPTYRIDGEWVEAIFTPAHEIDRRLRPSRWLAEW